MAPSVEEILRPILTSDYWRSTVLYSLFIGVALVGVLVLTFRHMTTQTEHDQMLTMEKAQQTPPYSKDRGIRQNDIILSPPLQETSAYRRIRSSSEDPLAGVYYPITSGQLASMADMNTTHRELIQALTGNVLELEGLSESQG